MTENKKSRYIGISRRQFISQAVKAGLSITAAVAIAKIMYTNNPPAIEEDKKLVTVPDFSIPQLKGKLSIAKGPDRIQTVQQAIDKLGGIEKFVQKGDVVLIKPNIAFATPASLGATANPELVAEVVRLCYSRGGAKEVIVTDNPINTPSSCFTISGIGKAASAAGANVIMPKDSDFSNTTLANGTLIKDWPLYYGPLAKADKLIGISPVKDHHRSGASMSMKNFYGLLGGRRNIFHQDINGIISELAMLVKPTLVILDGTVVMKSNGPTGGSLSDLKRADTMIVSTDPVAADSFGATLLDMKVGDLPYLTLAENAGIGTTNYEPI
ncbi:MAG: DUF362 domain-containing protein [Sedimentisphaerales bacterium]|nr:DUF362 domain-containing protein [Sedimentisphaerales bacterium]